MIEFKAECGHTVRAKDEDSGGVVRCSYCGRKAAVPDEQDHDLDFLFTDVDEPTSPASPGKRPKGRPPRRLFSTRSKKSKPFSPFSIVLRMCYAALLISIVIFVGRKWVFPLFEHGVSGRVVNRSTGFRRETKEPREERERRGPRVGLINPRNPKGLYVASMPPRAMVYCVEASKVSRGQRVSEIAGCTTTRANTDPLRLPDGDYVVEVVLPSNDARLNDRSLPNYSQYRTFRRTVEDASDEHRARLLEEYFLPDEAWPVFIDETEERYYIVRQYRNVQIRNGRSKGVRALFLPKIMLPNQRRYNIAQLVTHYIPKERAYAFDEDHVRNELEYYGVPEADRLFVVEALARIGVIPYITANGQTRLFKLGIDDGDCTAKDLGEANE